MTTITQAREKESQPPNPEVYSNKRAFFIGRFGFLPFFFSILLSPWLSQAFGDEPVVPESVFCEGKRPLPKAPTQNPLLEKSPQENIHAHDVVFLGEVLVPAKYCSIGICAGLRVHQLVKGKLTNNSVVSASVPENLLIRIKTEKKHQGSQKECLSEDIFTKRAQYWYVFAQGGTSKRGFIFYEVSDVGPSFETRAPIDFSQLEQSYQKFRKELDDAIKSRFGLRYQ